MVETPYIQPSRPLIKILHKSHTWAPEVTQWAFAQSLVALGCCFTFFWGPGITA